MSEHSSTENFVDEVETVEQAPEPVDAADHAPKKVIGRPITKETDRAYQMSSTQAKRARKEARTKMLAALTHDLDIGVELLKAMRSKDDTYLNMIERAARLTGLEWNQSDEGRIANLNVKSENTNTTTGTLEVVVKGLDVK